MIPPKPAPRADHVSLWQYLRLFRRDILSAQPARLYRAWMAEFRTPFFRSYLLNQPDLVRHVLRDAPGDFPKSDRIAEGLRPLLGDRSVFLTNGAMWQRQRRMIDPAFEGGRLRDTYPAMLAAGQAAVARLAPRSSDVVEIEEACSHAAADVIFRTLFSLPIDDALASETFAAFRDYQRQQPILNAGAFLRLPRWMPRLHSRRTRRAARRNRSLIAGLIDTRIGQIARGTAPDDLATKILTTTDPQTGDRFGAGEMLDQVAIFFLAGHETSASALAWALYLLAADPAWQDRVAAEAQATDLTTFAGAAKLTLSRDVFREALRLYPPVPMMVREARCPVTFRGRAVAPGAQIVLSPWHLHRHTRLWDNPDSFDPARWSTPNGRHCARDAYIPFSAGARVCPGAGFAMLEGPLLLSLLTRAYRFAATTLPDPVAFLTVRARTGIHLSITART